MAIDEIQNEFCGLENTKNYRYCERFVSILPCFLSTCAIRVREN